MTLEELKYYVLLTIGSQCDEVTLCGNGNENSFCEMDQGVFHVEIEGAPCRYFRVELTPTTEDHYFDRITPDSLMR
jgi:hypothetical protein